MEIRNSNKPQSISYDCPPQNAAALENVQALITKYLTMELHTLALPEHGNNMVRAYSSSNLI
jgi:hypothetical protein